MFLKLFKKNKSKQVKDKEINTKRPNKKDSEHVAIRKGEIGEYKINIQLDQLPKEYKYLSDVMLENPRSITGYSQIDHIVITPYGIFVIETKNYQGTIYGGKGRKQWYVNGKFKMLNPFIQNYGHIKALKVLIDKKFHNNFISMVSFTKRCTFKIDIDLRKINSDDLIVYDVELSDFINRKVAVLKLTNKDSLIQTEEISSVYKAIQEANITDGKIREEHNNGIKNKKGVLEEKVQNRCAHCNQPVSDKVANFCRFNKKFGGKIYCYSHQKIVNK